MGKSLMNRAHLEGNRESCEATTVLQLPQENKQHVGKDMTERDVPGATSRDKRRA